MGHGDQLATRSGRGPPPVHRRWRMAGGAADARGWRRGARSDRGRAIWPEKSRPASGRGRRHPIRLRRRPVSARDGKQAHGGPGSRATGILISARRRGDGPSAGARRNLGSAPAGRIGSVRAPASGRRRRRTIPSDARAAPRRLWATRCRLPWRSGSCSGWWRTDGAPCAGPRRRRRRPSAAPGSRRDPSGCFPDATGRAWRSPGCRPRSSARSAHRGSCGSDCSGASADTGCRNI